MKSRPTAERIKEVLSYDRDTGVFVWNLSRGRAVVGARAGKLLPYGRRLWIDGIELQASHVAWFLVNGEWPSRLLRFKDGDVDNAAISNLKYGEFDNTTKAGRAASVRKWRKANPRSQRHLILKRSYGMTVEQYQDMLVSQGGVCACCGKPETAFCKGQPLPLSVDHDHSTNEVRGLLCASCNHMLGKAKDDPAILRSGADYLDRHASKRSESNVVPLNGRKIANERGK